MYVCMLYTSIDCATRVEKRRREKRNTFLRTFEREGTAYLFQMLVHPFGKCFLLYRVSFV